MPKSPEGCILIVKHYVRTLEKLLSSTPRTLHVQNELIFTLMSRRSKQGHCADCFRGHCNISLLVYTEAACPGCTLTSRNYKQNIKNMLIIYNNTSRKHRKEQSRVRLSPDFLCLSSNCQVLVIFGTLNYRYIIYVISKQNLFSIECQL